MEILDHWGSSCYFFEKNAGPNPLLGVKPVFSVKVSDRNMSKALKVIVAIDVSLLTLYTNREASSMRITRYIYHFLTHLVPIYLLPFWSAFCPSFAWDLIFRSSRL